MTQTKVEAPFVENSRHFRNFIINGDMNIWQRATGATTVTDGGYNTLDRWHNVFYGTDGAMTSEREALSVADQATTGMYYCNLLKCTTADTSIATNSIVGFRQTIEAQFCQPFLYGTSAAKTLTVSFYAKANASKTYSLSLWKRDSTAYYWFKDISVTDSWQKFTYVITPTAGSTSLITSSGGAIANDNGEGLELTFVLVAGTNYDGTADTWQDSGSDAQRFYDGSIDNFLSSTDNTLRITGVQLEIGDTATDFEHLPFDIQLTRCLRYYYDLASTGIISAGAPTYVCNASYYSASNMFGFLHFPTPMRTEPTLTTTNASNTFYFYRAGAGDGLDDLVLNTQGSKLGGMLQNETDASGTAGQAGGLYLNSGKICNLSAEL